MRAADTNVLVRIVTGDDAAQYARAIRFFESEEVFIPKSAMLELEWVLRFSYSLEVATIAQAMFDILDTAHVSGEDEPAVREAIGLFRGGMDFADALNLTSSAACADLVTFDKGFVKLARRLTPARVTPL